MARPKKTPTPFGERPPLKPEQWKALLYEHYHPEASYREVARHVGVSHTTVENWWSDPDYNERGRVQVCAQILTKELERNDQKPPPVGESWENFVAFIHENWNGPIASMIDGKTYDNPDAYLEHVRECGGVWVRECKGKPGV